MTKDQYLEKLSRYAIGAMNKGADPVKVNQRLQKELASKGLSGISMPLTADGASEDVVSKVRSLWYPFENVTSGVSSTAETAEQKRYFDELEARDRSRYAEDMGARGYDPDSSLFQYKDERAQSAAESERAKAQNSFLENTRQGIRGSVGRGVGGLLGIAGALTNSDDTMALAKDLVSYGNRSGERAAGAGGFAGGAVGALTGAFLGEPMASGMNELDEGRSLADAQMANLKGSALNAAGVGLGLPFGAGRGFHGILSRAGVQVPGSVGLQIADNLYEANRLEGIGRKGPQWNDNLGVAAGTGLFGSLFRNPPRERTPTPTALEEKPPSLTTGDAAVDAGVKAFDGLLTSADNRKKVLGGEEQLDLFNKNNEGAIQGDLFGEPVPGSTAESRRRNAADPLTPARTEADVARLESDYILGQQERLNRNRNFWTRSGDEDLPLPAAQADLWNVGVPPDATPISKTILQEPKNDGVVNPTTREMPQDYSVDDIRGYSEHAPNEAMRDAFRDAGLRRAAGMGGDNLYPDTAHSSEGMVAGAVGNTEVPSVFEPSRNPVVEQPVPVQGEMNLPEALPKTRVADLEDGRVGAATGDLFPQDHPTLPAQKSAPQAAPVTAVDTTPAASGVLASLQERLADPSLTPAQRARSERMLKAEEARQQSKNAIRTEEGDNKAGAVEDSETIRHLENDPEASFLGLTRDDTGGVHSSFYDPAASPDAWRAKAQDGSLTFRNVLDDIINAPKGTFDDKIVSLAKYAGWLSKKFGGDDVRFRMFDEDDPVHQAYLLRKNQKGEKAGAGYYSTEDHTVRLGTDGTSMHAFLHEGFHALTSRIIDAGFNKKLTGPAAKAYTNLTNIFEAIRDMSPQGGVSPRERLRAYGTKLPTTDRRSMHEFLTELFTSPVFRERLRSIDIDTLRASSGITAKLSLARVSNAYQAVVRSIREMFGLRPSMENALDATISGAHEFFLTADPRDAKAIQRKTAGSGWIAFDSEGVGNQPLTRPKGSLETKILNLLAAKGARPAVSDFSTGVSDSMAGTNALNNALSTRFNRESGKLRGMEDTLSDALYNPEQRTQALAEIEKVSPAMAESLRREIKDSSDNSLKIAALIREMPNATDAQLKAASAAEALHDSYSTRSYAVDIDPTYADSVLTKYREGDKSTVAMVNRAKQAFAKKLLPEDADLMRLSDAKLDALYRVHTGGPARGSMSRLDKLDAVMDRIDNVSDRNTYLDNAIETYLKNPADNVVNDYINSVGLGRAVGSNLTDISAPIRALRGEITHPIHRAILTRANQEMQIAQLTGQKELRERGIKEGLFTTKPDTATHSQVITGEANGFLQGLYTTPDIAQALRTEADVKGFLRQAYDALGTATAVNKFNTIVGNPGNILVNATGSILQPVMNGVTNAKAIKEGIATSMQMIGQHLRGQVDPRVEYMLRNGYSRFSMTPELQRRAKGLGLVDLLEEASKQPNPATWLKERSKDAFSLYNDIYGATDLWSKYAVVFNELDFWKKQRPQWTQAELDRFVKQRIDATTISPDSMPAIFKHADKSGATFVARYMANVFKNVTFNYVYGLRDIAEGTKTGNAAIVAHGAKRLIGTTAAAGSIPYLVDMLTGPDDATRDYLDKSPITAARTNMVLEDANKKQYLLDTDRPQIHGPAGQVVLRMYKALDTALNDNPKKSKEHLAIAGKNFLDMFLGSPNSLFRKVQATMTGKGTSLERNAPELYDKVVSSSNLSVENINRILNASDIALPKVVSNILGASQSSATTPFKLAMGAGVGVTEYDVGKDAQRYLGREFNKKVDAARKDYVDLLKQGGDISDERLEAAFRKGLRDIAEPFSKLEAAMAAGEEQGLSKREMAMKLHKTLNKAALAKLMNGKVSPVHILMGDIESILKSNIENQTNEERKKKLIGLAAQRHKAINKIAAKYSGVTFDDIINNTGVME